MSDRLREIIPTRYDEFLQPFTRSLAHPKVHQIETELDSTEILVSHSKLNKIPQKELEL